MTDERTRAADLDRRLSPTAAEPFDSTNDEQSLMRFALQVRETLRPPALRPAFTAAARRRLLSRLPTQPAPRRLVVPGAVRRLVFAAASVLVALSLGTAGVAYAAQEALPGEALYGVKLSLESARWSLTAEPKAQVELLSEFAAERVHEVEALAEAGSDALVTQTLEAYQQTLEQLQTVAASLPEGIRAGVIVQAEAQVQQHVIVLERVKAQVPEQARAAIERALDRSSHSREVLEQLEQGTSPSDLAPGRNKAQPHGAQRTPGHPDSKGKP